jgi:replicative DNA helicase
MADIEKLLIDKVAHTGSVEKILIAGLNEDSFEKEELREIFLFIVAHFRKYKLSPSLQTIKEKFPEHLFEISHESLEYLKDEQINLIKRRAAMSALYELAEAIDDPEQIPQIDYLFLEKARELTNLLPGTVYSSFKDMDKRIQEYELGETFNSGIEMGIPEIDYLTSGIQPHEYITIAGFSGTGKSTLAQYILHNSYMQGKTPMYISLEMEAKALFRKWDTMTVNFEYNRLKRGTLHDDDIMRWKEAADIIRAGENDMIVLDDVRGCTVDRVYAELTRHVPDILCIDYITLMDTTRTQGTQMWEKVTNITQQLKQISRSLKIPIIGVAQTNRSGYQSGATMDNMAFSQSIVNDSDIILGLHQDEEMKEAKKMELRLLKNRDGQTAECNLLWKMKTMEFRSWKDSDAFLERK